MSDDQEFIPDDGEDLEEKVKAIITFNINDQRIAAAAEEFKGVDAYVDHAAAKKAKKVLTKMRTTLADSHKKVKAEALAHCQDVDAEKRRLLGLIGEIEDPISKQLTEIKEADDKKEEERLAKIMAGIERIQTFSLDRHSLTVEQLNERINGLAEIEITEEIFQESLTDAENARTVVESKLLIELTNAEERAEAGRKQAETEEENRKLRKQLDAQQEKDDAATEEKRQQDEADAAEQRKKDDDEAAERKKAQDKIDEEQAAAQKVIDDENDRLQKIADDAEAERKQKEADDLAAIQAPDADKLALFGRHIQDLIDAKPVLQSDVGNAILLTTIANLIATLEDLRESAGEL